MKNDSSPLIFAFATLVFALGTLFSTVMQNSRLSTLESYVRGFCHADNTAVMVLTDGKEIPFTYDCTTLQPLDK